MKNGAALKLTTARYYTPNNRSIQATGIQPDIVSRQLELATSPGPTHGDIRESDLAGHLENENDASNETVDETAPAELLQDRDFEVGEALNLLKGMVIARRQVDQ
jgi:carboxyl-terminal processing protease